MPITLLSPELTLFISETFIILIILILTPTFKELRWRGYEINSLEKNKNIIKITFIYGTYLYSSLINTIKTN